MALYNLEGLYKGKKRRNIVFKTWRSNKDEVMAEIEPIDYYGIKDRYTDLKVVVKEC